jgi:ketosteroid isomerase-like protein
MVQGSAMDHDSAINRHTENGDTIEVKDAFTQRTSAANCELAGEIRAWLDHFAAAVRDQDFETGRQLFAPDVIGFGTVGVMLKGLDALLASQWKKIWPGTSGFHFHTEHLTCNGDADIAWAAVPWTSLGRRPNGEPFERHGRATYILHRRDGQWQAVHSHHSLDPLANS